jgi:uncharacterized protein YegL
MRTNGTENGRAPDRNALHVAFVLDQSGSMSHLAQAVVAGFDEFVEELRADNGGTLFSLTTFDTTFAHVHVGVPLTAVPSLAVSGYRPGGMTALFDAVAHTVLATDRRLAESGRSDEKVMVVVMTDGLENSSTDYTMSTLADLIETYDTRPNWTFVYLGAAHGSLEDAMDVADAMAFKRSNAMRWSADDASAMKSMRSLGAAAKSRRRAQSLKTEQLFADAGQDEADYRSDVNTPRPKPASPFTKRDMRDVLDRRNRTR